MNILQQTNPSLLISSSEFIRPKMEGRTDTNLFGKIPVKIDPLFKKHILDPLGENYSDEERRYFFFQTGSDNNSDTSIIDDIDIKEFSTPSEIFANLAYLSANPALLKIPAGQEEINFILGYLLIGGKIHVAFMEHEFEDGKEEIHLHLRLINSWGDDTPIGFARGNETSIGFDS